MSTACDTTNQDHLAASARIKNAINTVTFTKLQNQIGHYDSSKHYRFELAEAEKKELYHHCTTNNKQDPNYYRRAFLHYIRINQHRMPRPTSAELAMRRTHPDRATISMQQFFDKQGLALYLLALEEEANSREFMDAVLHASTRYYPGPKWAHKPIVIVAGPSSCGKTFSANAAMKKCLEFLSKKIPYQHSGNFCITVDGGMARETSQIRKIAIQIANLQGFSGLKDIYSQSSVLDIVKSRIKNTALTSKHGVIIPETFSKPFSGSVMRTADHIPNSRLIFTRVEGERPSLFQRIVAFMGLKRAWKTEGFDKENDIAHLDLNRKKVVESKPYQPGGFFFGVLGSKIAEIWYNLFSKHKLSMIIQNDLIALKQGKNKNEWIETKQNDPGTLLVSHTTYKKWLALSDADKEKLSLHDMPQIKPKIQTSVQIDIAILIENISKEIVKISSPVTSNIKFNYLNQLRKTLENINSNITLETIMLKKYEIQLLASDIKDKMNGFLKHNLFGFFFDSTIRTLRDTIYKLNHVDIKLTNMKNMFTSKHTLSKSPAFAAIIKHDQHPATQPEEAVQQSLFKVF